MAIYKVVYMFNLAEQGWTETYYKEEHTALAATQLVGPPNQIINWRAVGCQLFAIRASNVALPRDAYTQFLGYSVAPVLGSSGNVLNTPDPATTCVLWRVTSLPNTQRRFVWIRGLQDRDVNRRADGTPSPSPALNANLVAYAAFLKDQRYQIYYLTPAIAPFQWYGVQLMAPNLINSNWTDLTALAPIAGLAAGDRVYFRAVDKRIFPHLTGSYPCYPSSAGPNIYTIHYKLLQSNAVQPQGMQVRRQAYLTNPITNFQIEDFREHLTGRPTERYRGRKSASRVPH